MKRLIVCCDGTWQDLQTPYPTNVVKIAQAIEATASDGISQVVFYDAGIGTEGNTKIQKKVDRIVGGNFGKGIDQNIQDGYRFLSLNYSPGDEIYLFGFSRGAYTVRSLAGLMYNSGLLSSPHIRQISQAYELYRNRLDLDKSNEIEAFREKYSFKTEKYGSRVPITLLACWDTVGSLGLPDLIPFMDLDKKMNEKYQFHDQKLNPIIQNALHAVAIDEQRKLFHVTLMEKSPETEEQQLIQKWFPGDHGCIGGGVQEQSSLSDGTLQWTIDSIKELRLNLEIDPSVIPTGVNPNPIDDLNIEANSWIDKLKKIREVSDDFNDLHEGVKIRWQSREDYRPVNLKKFEDLLNE